MKKVILVLIVFLAAMLRLWKLSTFPAGLNADEAALGYNAYSLMQTGRDEHGHLWPLNFESFGDFKPALYGYLLIPFVKVLGLNVLAVRLPSALIGVFAVILIYVLAQELFGDEKISLIAAGALAISPWHLHFSRGGWEVNVASTLIIFGMWQLVRWSKNPRFSNLAWAIVAFVASLYTYQSARLTAPVLFIALLIYFRGSWWGHYRQLIIGGVFGLILALPVAYSLMMGGSSRFAGVGLLADQGPVNRVNELRGQHPDKVLLFGKILHNKPIAYSLQFFKNYTDHFSPNFLFINGDVIQRNRTPETGQLYWTDIIFLIIGVAFLVRTSHTKSGVVWILLAVAPLAAGLTFQTPHALRAQLMVVPLIIIIALGISRLVQHKILAIIILLLYGYQFVRYGHEYYIHYPQTYPAAWEYGFDQVADYVEKNSREYPRVYITDKYDQPYILMLFFLKYPPAQFQFHHDLTVRDQFNFSTVNAFDKFTFTDTDWNKLQNVHNALIVAAPEDVPTAGVNVIKTIYFPNNQPAFKIIAN